MRTIDLDGNSVTIGKVRGNGAHGGQSVILLTDEGDGTFSHWLPWFSDPNDADEFYDTFLTTNIDLARWMVGEGRRLVDAPAEREAQAERPALVRSR